MIPEYFHNVVRQHRDQLALVDDGQRITYGELSASVQAAREWLCSTLGPKPGDVIAVSLDNSWQFAACFFAVSGLGCVLAPCNPQWRAAELRALAGRLELRGAIVESRFAAEWNHLVDVLPKDSILTADHIPAAGGTAFPSSPLPVESLSEDSPALYLSTSGSTGTPRVVPRTHRNLIANAENVGTTLGLGPGRRFLSVVPFHYASGFNNSMLVPLLNGATVATIRQFNPATCAELVRLEQIDTLVGSPFIYGSVLDNSRDPSQLSTLQWCFCGGGRIPSSVVERWRARFGVTIRQLYGTTEVGAIAIDRGVQQAESFGTCIGEPVRGVEVITSGPDGRTLGPGEIGELAVRSEAVMAGYLGEPELSRSRFHNGFFRTGDLGYVDSAGALHLTGRMSRVMNIAGVKVDPVEVERAVETLSNVASCHVDAIPNESGGEVIRARVSVREGLAVTRRDVIEQCRSQLAEYKLPRVIEFTEPSPDSLAGKTPRHRAEALPQWKSSGPFPQ